MSSEALTNASAYLEGALRAALPSTWRIQDAEAPLSKSLGVVLTYQQTDLANEINGTRLGPGNLGLDFVLIVSAPETDPVKSVRTVTDAAAQLAIALDSVPDLFWDRATKGRLTTGETFYEFRTTYITSYL